MPTNSANFGKFASKPENSSFALTGDAADTFETNKALEKQKNLIMSLIDSIPDIVFFKDMDGKYLGCNAAFCAFIGLSKDKVIGKTDYDFFDAQIAARFRQGDQEVLMLGKTTHIEEALVSHEGTYTYRDTLKAPFCNDEGSVIGTIGISRDITDRRLRENEIQFLSFHDQLTGLYNRRFYEEELRRLDTERNLPITFIIGDINDLKFINDSFGHESGDALIKSAAEAMKSVCRSDDIIARIGGDEFAMILPKTDFESGLRIVERIENTLTSKRVGALNISVSLGSATKTSIDQQNHDTVKKAEDRMYQKKLEQRMVLRNNTIDLVISTLYDKNTREMEHSRRVGRLCESIALHMDMRPEVVSRIKLAGIMHDIGKVDIDEKILEKKDGLSQSDWEKLRNHPEIGYRILSTSREFCDIAPYVYEHHEKWDGSGYPRGLQGEQILLPSRIVAVAEAYDAIEHPIHGKPHSPNETIDEMLRNAGTQFDPGIVGILAAIVRSGPNA